MIEMTDKQYWQLNELLPQPIKDANIATHAKTGEYAMLPPTVFRIRNSKGIVEDNDIAAVAAVLASGTPLFFRGRKQNAKIAPSDAKQYFIEI